MAKKRKWCVVDVVNRQYVSGLKGELAWTTDLSEAVEIAAVIPNGKVVDAEWLSVNWKMWRDYGTVADEALPPKPKMSSETPVIKPNRSRK